MPVPYSQRNKEAVQKHRKKRKQRMVEYKGGRCSICGFDKYIEALQFHHLIPAEKSFGIGDGNTRSWDLVLKELDKCILVCANCHAGIEAGHIQL